MGNFAEWQRRCVVGEDGSASEWKEREVCRRERVVVRVRKYWLMIKILGVGRCVMSGSRKKCDEDFGKYIRRFLRENL